MRAAGYDPPMGLACSTDAEYANWLTTAGILTEDEVAGLRS
jgi:hypothetical protein